MISIINFYFQPPPHELTEEEQWAEEHRKMHEKHKGHEAMHMEMMVIFMISVIVGQIFLVTWKRKHFKSYQVFNFINFKHLFNIQTFTDVYINRNAHNSSLCLFQPILVSIPGHVACFLHFFSFYLVESLGSTYQWRNTKVFKNKKDELNEII